MLLPSRRGWKRCAASGPLLVGRAFFVDPSLLAIGSPLGRRSRRCAPDQGARGDLGAFISPSFFVHVMGRSALSPAADSPPHGGVVRPLHVQTATPTTPSARGPESPSPRARRKQSLAQRHKRVASAQPGVGLAKPVDSPQSRPKSAEGRETDSLAPPQPLPHHEFLESLAHALSSLLCALAPQRHRRRASGYRLPSSSSSRTFW